MVKRFHRQGTKESLSVEEGLIRIYRYCAYQERSHQEVRNKLFEFGIQAHQVDELLARMITEGYLNEERFSRTYTGGKFRIKKWGRLKIQRELSRRGLTENCIARGLKEIDQRDYIRTIGELIQKKESQMHDDNLFRKRDKIARFVIGKGYEPELVWEILKRLLPDE